MSSNKNPKEEPANIIAMFATIGFGVFILWFFKNQDAISAYFEENKFFIMFFGGLFLAGAFYAYIRISSFFSGMKQRKEDEAYVAKRRAEDRRERMYQQRIQKEQERGRNIGRRY